MFFVSSGGARSGKKTRFISMFSNSPNMSNSAIYKKVRSISDEEIRFIHKESNKDITYEKLLMILSKTESTRGNVNLLNRIIREGGFVNYVNWLEAIK